MFTGIVETVGEVVRSRSKGKEGRRIELALDELPDGDTSAGASISINGICLTVAEFDSDGLTFDVSGETLEKTTLGEWSRGRMVNLEASLGAGDPVGGHFVTGHVDGTARVEEIRRGEEFTDLTIRPDRDFLPFLAPKGSVALDGVSLTVNQVNQGKVSIRLVPHTLQVTNLSERTPGDLMNLEVDVIARYLYNFKQFDDLNEFVPDWQN